VGDQTGHLRLIKAGFACGSMVRFYLYCQKFALHANFWQ